MPEATLSSKNQIVVPREAREALGVRPGDKLLIVVRGNSVVILPRPKSWSQALRGLAGQSYPENYLQKERDSWDSGSRE
ncbi:MAG: AbrB/MazE/SpoVT family DNA-binding domain-containing protein [Bryobacterales bacterium]|nr:AbrB/MazE/SpoVT family DNA-binding domain-containing protein [Bryobacterales bacterium]